MANVRLHRDSSPREANLLLLAVLFSLWGHGLVLGLYWLGLPWFHFARQPTPAELKHAAELRLAQKQQQAEPQLLFVQVDPSQPPVEAPKNTKNFSSKNSRAANVDALVETDTPKINGTQTHVPKPDDAPRTKALPAQPTVPKEPPPPQPAKTPPEEKQKPGDLAMAKPAEAAPEPPPPRQRPLRLAEVRPEDTKIPGARIKQEGGVKRRRISPAFDALGTDFGEYDERFIAAVRQRWYDLLDTQGVSMERTGKVVIEFRLNYDGSISEIKQVESSVSGVQEFLCEKAITDPAPFERWPIEMRRKLEADSIPVQFTFYY